MTSSGVYNLTNAHRIPDRSGLYSFTFNPFKLRRLGLFRDRPASEAVVAAARALLQSRLDTYDLIASQERAEGTLKHFSAAGRQLRPLRASLVSGRELTTQTLAAQVSDADFLEFLRTASAGSRFQPPLYVGMTDKQTLKARYRQHHSNYLAAAENTFGGRLIVAGINWEDLDFQCVEASFSNSDAGAIGFAEQLLIQMAEPKLNKRN